MAAIKVEIYSRPGCHLCDDAKAAIEEAAIRAGAEISIDLAVTNVDEFAELRAAYGDDIPVVFVNGREMCRHRVDKLEFERTLKRLWNESTF